MSEATHKLTIEIMRRFLETLKGYKEKKLTIDEAIEVWQAAIDVADETKMFV